MTSAARIFRQLGCAAAVLVLTLNLGTIAQAQSLSSVTRTNRGVVELLTSGDPGSIAMAQDLASVVDDGATRRVLPVVGYGAIEGLTDLKVLHGIDMAVVQTDVLDYAKRTIRPLRFKPSPISRDSITKSSMYWRGRTLRASRTWRIKR